MSKVKTLKRIRQRLIIPQTSSRIALRPPLMAAPALIKLSTTNPFPKPASRTKMDPYTIRILKPQLLQNPWLGTKSVALHSSILRPKGPKNRPVTATVSFNLPTANTDGSSTDEKVSKWSWRAIKSFAMGQLEARKLKYPTTGTEALLMGILVEGTSLASKFLRANGITLLKVREETVKLLGKGDLYFFSPERPPLTEEAQRALDWAVDQKIKSGSAGEITTSWLLLGIWSEVGSPGQKILAKLGFDDEKAKELKSLSSDSGSVDDD